jgi:hypothetical protein
MLKHTGTAAFVVALGLVASPLAPAPRSLQAQEAHSLAGDWEGTLSLPDGRAVGLVFHVIEAEDGALSASLDVPEQGAAGIVCETATIDGDALHISGCQLPGSGGYDGTLNEEGTVLEGEFQQAGMSFPLALSPADPADEG